MNDKLSALKAVSFGQRVAEEESDLLGNYFVETDQWQRLYDGQIDIIYGPKGSGKSALYSLLMARRDKLFDRRILLITAENPRGATAFKDLASDPPDSEPQFVAIWKLYFCSLIHAVLQEYEIRNEFSKKLESELSDIGLVEKGLSLSAILQKVKSYIKGISSAEVGVTFDPNTGIPNGISGKIAQSGEAKSSAKQFPSFELLLGYANSSFKTENLSLWILLDRLDVAFAENLTLETNALRALFRVYLDLLEYENIKLKVFLRTDIWSRITEAAGFREASHITRHMTIEWNQNSLLNLIVKRSLSNTEIKTLYSVDGSYQDWSSEKQQQFFERMFPDQVDIGSKKPKTFDWMISRTRDGTKKNAPRELIHLLSQLRNVQVARVENGESLPDKELLFSRASFKEALPEISRVRLQQTLYSEYPEKKAFIEQLKNEKTEHTPDSLAKLWNIEVTNAARRAEELAAIGFFEVRGTKSEPIYWVPHLYRDALELVQGAAD
jgi:hypothetical protein